MNTFIHLLTIMAILWLGLFFLNDVGVTLLGTIMILAAVGYIPWTLMSIAEDSWDMMGKGKK